jgi:hypothetical protein
VIPNPAARVSVKPTLQIMALELPAASAHNRRKERQH